MNTRIAIRRRPQAPGAVKTRQSGFTLVEVLVAIVVFAIAIVGLVAIEGRSIEAQRASAYLREGERDSGRPTHRRSRRAISFSSVPARREHHSRLPPLRSNRWPLPRRLRRRRSR